MACNKSNVIKANYKGL